MLKTSSRHELSAQIEPSVPYLRLIVEPVPVVAVRTEQMHDLVAPGGEQLGDQPPVAAPPDRLRAHEAGLRLGEGRRERVLPLRAAHARRVAPESTLADASETPLPPPAA